jgi:hypothetical protein
MKNPRYVAAGLRGSARGFQNYSRANYQDLGPIMLRLSEGPLEPWVREWAIHLQNEQRKSSRKARAQLFRLLRLQRG